VNGRRMLVGVVAAAILSGACGDDSGQSVAIAPRAERQLSTEFAAIRKAVIAKDRVAARSAVRDLQGSVSDLQAVGSVTADRAGRILAAAQTVLDHLSLLPAPSPPQTVVPSPATESPAEGEGHGAEGTDEPPGHESNEGNGHGNGEGNAYGHEAD
jgi:hypothetical protein